ncbi:MAG: 3-dehydroquinate synthase [Oscillospiraceae bacterium]|nr:3-dehydroquinate synthase [Oscillospiraceae bacterium]
MHHTVHIPLSERAYDVRIGPGLLEKAGALIAEKLRPTRVLLVTDSNVAKHDYVDSVMQSLKAQGVACHTFIFQAGEASKSLYTYEKILDTCTGFSLYSGDALIALGGGVTGDLTGFAAATYRRGIAYAQMPTTLLAAVDASVGGKTGVNLPAGKNLAGAFWQPSLVITDTDTFNTLPPEEYANGMAECLKHGVLFDEGLFASLEHGGPVSAAQVARNVELKRACVLADERDTGRRRLLNLGHTLGHAIEKVSDYTIPHGAAVGLGMVMISRVFCPAIVDRLCAALESNRLPTHCEYSIQELFSALEQDKKRAGNNITIVVPLKIGECELRTMPMSELKRLLEEKV